MTFDGGSGYNLNGSQLDVAGALTSPATPPSSSTANTNHGSLIMSYNDAARASKSAPVLPSKPAHRRRVRPDAAAEAWTSAVPSFPAPAIAPIVISPDITFYRLRTTSSCGGSFTAPNVANFAAGTLSNASYSVPAGSTLRLSGRQHRHQQRQHHSQRRQRQPLLRTPPPALTPSPG